MAKDSMLTIVQLSNWEKCVQNMLWHLVVVCKSTSFMLKLSLMLFKALVLSLGFLNLAAILLAWPPPRYTLTCSGVFPLLIVSILCIHSILNLCI